ncbi:uncharacterized protein tedc2 [Menidia menidia]
MSLLSSVQQRIKSSKDELSRLNDSIQYLREILQSLTLHPKVVLEEPELADHTVADTSTEEKNDIELLERALEKALQVRQGSEPAKKDLKLCATQKKADSSMNVLHSSKGPKGSQTAIKSTSKCVSIDRNIRKKSGLSVCTTLSSRTTAGKPVKSKNHNRNTIQNHSSISAQAVHHQPSRKLQQAVSASASLDQITTSLPKNTTVRSNMLSDDDPSRAASVSMPSSNNVVPSSDTDGSEASNWLQQNELLSEQTSKWKSLRHKKNRLLEKVIALQRKPIPGRSHFMERMRATFPEDWPCGSPDQTRVQLGSLIEKGLDLVWRCQEEEILEMATKLGSKQNNSRDSCVTLERSELTPVEFHILADQVKQEWKAWDRWSPEGGCLCPSRASGAWGDGKTSPLPLIVTYREEAELKELERVRMSVQLLQQEIYLEQVLWDALSPHISSLEPGPACPNPTMLRDMYSLLGEGGQHFPAIVLDSEPE